MSKNTLPASPSNPSYDEGEARYHLGSVTCSQPAGHVHPVKGVYEEVAPRVWLKELQEPVRVRKDVEGKLYRVFGLLGFDRSTHEIFIRRFDGATDEESQSLMVTATAPRPDAGPEDWDAHPCRSGWNLMYAWRQVDDEYLEEVAEMLFDDLVTREQQDAFTKLTEDTGLTWDSAAETETPAVTR